MTREELWETEWREPSKSWHEEADIAIRVKKELLEQCGLEELAKDIHEVSGGQCQRAAIARGTGSGTEGADLR